jgi:hypothetical protein
VTRYEQGALDVLEGLATDPTPARVDERVLIAAAVTEAARDRRGLVHITAVRRHLPQSVSPRYLGAAMNRLVRRGALVATGRYEANGDNAASKRNASKASPVWRLVRPITESDYS